MSRSTPLPLEAFEAMLEAFGADPARWPDAQRGPAEALLAASAPARALLREARALDALLVAAPTVAPGRHAALADRIVAAAGARPVLPAVAASAGPAKVVPFARPAIARSVPTAGATALRSSRRPPWRAAAALAASLAAGVLIGSLDQASGPLRGLVEFASLESDADHVVAALHTDGLTAALDEDHR